jgi:hypothetical protein
MIQAIQTAYKGYHFRSRLEARWAVFFDALGLQWEYEPEGFALPDGSRYLPDFLLRDNRKTPDLWIEIKPAKHIAEKEILPFFKFACEITKQRENVGCLVLTGVPPGEDLYVVGSFGGRRASGELAIDIFLPRLLSATSERVEQAAISARSARFEHGESGATL